MPRFFDVSNLRSQHDIFGRNFEFIRPIGETKKKIERALADVSKWDKESGSRLLWWETFNPLSPLYLTIAKPLLSAHTVGSIAVERVAKPLKNKVMSKERNSIGVGRAEVLLRAGMNLRLLNKHKSMMQEMGLLQ